MVIKLTAIRNLDNGPYLILMFALIVPLYAVASKLNLDVCSNAPYTVGLLSRSVSNPRIFFQKSA